jgi:hypothetical protein
MFLEFSEKIEELNKAGELQNFWCSYTWTVNLWSLNIPVPISLFTFWYGDKEIQRGKCRDKRLQEYKVTGIKYKSTKFVWMILLWLWLCYNNQNAISSANIRSKQEDWQLCICLTSWIQDNIIPITWSNYTICSRYFLILGIHSCIQYTVLNNI